MRYLEKLVDQRAYGMEAALMMALEEAKKNDIDVNFQLLSEIRKQDRALCTYISAANNNQTKVSFLGGGSGDPTQAKVKAIYESLEDSLTLQMLSKKDNENIHLFSTMTSPSTAYLQEHELLPKLLWQDEYKKKCFPWFKLTAINNSSQELYYPLGLVYSFASQLNLHPDAFNHADITKLTNNTGCAIGASKDEAIIHGLNEWIERDAYALFILKTIINKNPRPAYFVIKETIPEDLLNLITMIETHFKEELIIVDITSDINIPAFIVSFTRQAMLVQPLGFGASLSKHAALQQALLEALQYQARFNENARSFRAETFAHFADHALIIKAMKCDLMELGRLGHYIRRDWQDVITHSLDSNLEKQNYVND